MNLKSILFLLVAWVPFVVSAQTAVYYIHTDHLGAPTRVTDANQTVVWSTEYEPFGATAPSGSIPMNLRFPGQYHDQETGLYYNWNRYYDPRTGRYLTSDPIGLAGGFNTYTYAGGNPINYTDPTGEVAPAIIGVFHVVRLAAPQIVRFAASRFGQATIASSKAALELTALTSAVIDGTPVGRLGGSAAACRVPNSGARFLADKAGRILDMDFFKGLKDSGQILNVSRSGKGRPLTGDPNTFTRTEGGHVVVFGADGRRVMDISSKRIKFMEWHQGKGGQLFPKEGNTTKFDGPVPQQILDQFGL